MQNLFTKIFENLAIVNLAGVTARAVFSYSAKNEDELNFTTGDVIVVLYQDLENEGWWKGRLNGKVGVFPNNFVGMIYAGKVGKQN